MILNTFRRQILVSILLVFLLTLITYAADYYSINNGSTVTINKFSVCKKVTNGTGNNIFVPTKTSTEWYSFINNKPSGVSLNGCLIPARTYSLGSACSVTMSMIPGRSYILQCRKHSTDNRDTTGIVNCNSSGVCSGPHSITNWGYYANPYRSCTNAKGLTQSSRFSGFERACFN